MSIQKNQRALMDILAHFSSLKSRIMHSQIILFVCATLAMLISGCVPQQPRFFAAFIRSDGRIQTNASMDGISWPTESRFIHPETSPFGPGLAATSKGLVALAFFQEDGRTNHKTLVVKQGLGSRAWESAVSFESTSEEDDVSSTPAISYIRDNVFALAWQDGIRIRTASFDANVQRGSRITGTGVVGSDAVGAPSIAFNGDRALMVWRSTNDEIGRAVGTLVNRRVEWEARDNLKLPFPPSGNRRFGIVGSPSVFFDGSRFFLTAIAFRAAVGDDGLVAYRVVVFDSEDGAEFQLVRDCTLRPEDRQSEIALAANNGSAFILRAPSVAARPNGVVIGPLPESCQERTWSAAFGDEGSTGGQKPAITHNSGAGVP